MELSSVLLVVSLFSVSLIRRLLGRFPFDPRLHSDSLVRYVFSKAV